MLVQERLILGGYGLGRALDLVHHSLYGLFHTAEQSLYLSRVEAHVVFVHKGVVEAASLACKVSLLLGKFDKPFKIRGEGLEIP